MKFKKVSVIILESFIIVFLLSFARQVQAANEAVHECGKDGLLEVSTTYAPYSVHVIKAQIPGTLKNLGAQEGEIVPAGHAVFTIDCRLKREELKALKAIENELKKSRDILKNNLQLARKKLARFQKLRKLKHLDQQALEDMQAKTNQTVLSLISNERQIQQTRQAIASLTDLLQKCAPTFPIDLYVAENFLLPPATVLAGEPISKLMDVSKAKLHIVLPIRCFKLLQKRLKRQKQISFTLRTENGVSMPLKGYIEKLKVDTDNQYLYSYGFDIIIKPLKGLLFGEVVTVEFNLQDK